MNVTRFPPFNMTMAAVDALTAARHIRIQRSIHGPVITHQPAQPGDEIFGCEGIQISVEKSVGQQLRGLTLDARKGVLLLPRLQLNHFGRAVAG